VLLARAGDGSRIHAHPDAIGAVTPTGALATPPKPVASGPRTVPKVPTRVFVTRPNDSRKDMNGVRS